jgi:transcriptional regulator with XRE-family HTH domain
MRTTVDYLDAVKAKLGLPSDYAAAKALRIAHSAISRYRNGKGSFDDEVAFRVAEILDINPLEVIVSARAERALNDDARSRWEGYWENFSRSFQSPVSRADARQLSLWPV